MIVRNDRADGIVNIGRSSFVGFEQQPVQPREPIIDAGGRQFEIARIDQFPWGFTIWSAGLIRYGRIILGVRHVFVFEIAIVIVAIKRPELRILERVA
ncbi:MAG: hypothetical protein ACO1O3_00610 [Sphingobium sp.]